MNQENKNEPLSKTAVISGFFKEIGLNEYLKYGGDIKKIDIEKTFTRYGDKNERKPIDKIEYSRFNEKGNSYIYKVFFKDGATHEYATNWISTLVSFRLSENHL